MIHFNAQVLLQIDSRGGAEMYAAARGAAVLGVSALLVEHEHKAEGKGQEQGAATTVH